METLKKICGHLEDSVLAQLNGDISCVDAKELGEVTDAIKDIKMAMYYGSIVEAMEEESTPRVKYYNGNRTYPSRRRDSRGRYMYTEPMDYEDGMDGMEYYHEPQYHMSMEQYRGSTPQVLRDMDRKQGRMYYTSPMRHLKRYFEHKGMADEGMKLQSLEEDLKEISEEITNMVGDMGNSEKQMLRTKLTSIAQKI